jgi:hypothetical protein
MVSLQAMVPTLIQPPITEINTNLHNQWAGNLGGLLNR